MTGVTVEISEGGNHLLHSGTAKDGKTKRLGYYFLAHEYVVFHDGELVKRGSIEDVDIFYSDL